MPGKTPRQAVGAFSDPIAKSIACIAEGVHLSKPRQYEIYPRIHSLNLIPVRAQLTKDIYLLVSHGYSIVRASDVWKIRTENYQYKLEDKNNKELVCYHWHPSAGVSFPHLHVGPALGSLYKDVSKFHFPTARTSVEAIVRFAIQEFGIAPVRFDWEKTLATNEAAFEKHRTWHGVGRKI